MNRIVAFFILCALVSGLFFTPAGIESVYAKSNPYGSTVDVIIQTDGGTAQVARSLQKMGGEIHFSYQNAPVIAATIPAGGIRDVYYHPNVVKVSKDRLVFLTEYGEDHTRPLSIKAADVTASPVGLITQLKAHSTIDPLGYGYFLNSQADKIWSETNLGTGSVVAVVDTGTVPNACLAHAVIGAPGYPNGYNATDDGIPATDPRNDWHGTHVGGVIASACKLDFTENTSDPLYQAISNYLPWAEGIIPVYGQAPNAQIYPVKVFDTNGGGSPLSVILDGLDHLLTLNSQNLLDIDIVNLSFGGPSWYDGRDILDSFLAKFREQNILVVAAAGNSGPIPNSIASPGTSLDSISVGALDYAASSRAIYEYLGLTWNLKSGQGLVMRPTDEIRVANLSSRGPMSDGRTGPDLSASGMWSFQFGPMNEPRWASGTSFSAAVVSGVAALLNSYDESKTNGCRDSLWIDLRNSLLIGANPDIVGASWQGSNTVGFGAVDAESAFQLFRNGPPQIKYPIEAENLRPNILGNPKTGDGIFESPTISLDPGESYDLVMEIGSDTSHVEIQVFDISTPDNVAYAYWPNSLKIKVQSAKRTDFPLPINEYWDPNLSGDNFTIEIENGLWSLAGVPEAHQPMEPGLMKVSLQGDFANESAISFNVRVLREQEISSKPERPIAKSVLKTGDIFNIPLEIPADLSRVTFDLVWQRDWQKFPTSDIDMLIYDPAGVLASSDGATGNTPEQAVINNPVPGTWTINIEAIELYKPDVFRLFMETETLDSTSNFKGMLRYLPSPFDIIAQQPAADSFPGRVDDTTSTYIIWLPFLP